jgi:hypothetical protein
MRFAVTLPLLWLFAGKVLADEPPLDEIVVTGEFAGPGMWKVTRPDDALGHVLWIVGDPPPLPKRIEWKSGAVEAVVLRSQEVLRDASVSMQPDEEIGFFRGITLLPAILNARKNPDEKSLRDLLPADLYARWLVQKKLYLGHESGIENWRPIFAADKLRKAAYSDLRIRDSGMVWETIGKLVEKRKIKVTTPMMKFFFRRNELREKIKEFSRESLSDVECFSTTLALTEALSDRDTENRRATAWATGDLQTLAQLPALPSPFLACATAVMNSQVAREVIPHDLRDQLGVLWAEAASASLEANQSTLAIAPIAKLLRAGGYLEALKQRGYLIEAPQ